MKKKTEKWKLWCSAVATRISINNKNDHFYQHTTTRLADKCKDVMKWRFPDYRKHCKQQHNFTFAQQRRNSPDIHAAWSRSLSRSRWRTPIRQKICAVLCNHFFYNARRNDVPKSTTSFQLFRISKTSLHESFLSLKFFDCNIENIRKWVAYTTWTQKQLKKNNIWF